MPKDIGGVEVETVADIIGDTPGEFLEVDSRLEMPRIDLTPDDPALGIHFNMPEELYHELPCASKTHLVNLAASPTIFWAQGWLNRDKVLDKREKVAKAIKDEKLYRVVGKAYHAMILEGRQAYESRFYVAPDPREHPKALRLVDEIKQAITERNGKPVTTVDVEGEPGKTRRASKDDWVAQLVAMDRTAEVWDDIMARAQRMAGTRAMISVDDDRQIRIAARMIAQDPQLAKAFKGGFPEVTLIWRDPRQGVLMKARVDYLKLRLVVDLKSFQNTQKRSIRRAIIRTLSENNYAFQPAVYLQGVEEVRKLIRDHGASAIHLHGDMGDRAGEATEFAFRWAKVTDPDRWLWCFQQKGDAPVTRGYYHPLATTYHSIAVQTMVEAVRTFRRCAEIYGTDPWLDLEEIDDLTEEELPLWSLDI